jgi:hypothetical protein
MGRHFLTEAACRSATLPERAKLSKLNDGEDLLILVTPAKRYRGRLPEGRAQVHQALAVRNRFGGCQSMLRLGDYSDITA